MDSCRPLTGGVYHSGRGSPTNSSGESASFGSSLLNTDPIRVSGLDEDFVLRAAFDLPGAKGECPGFSRKVLQPHDAKTAAITTVATAAQERYFHRSAI
ncbi:MAG: hypothetical protein ACYC6Y_22835 [Thermoguttaceae bacterium]